MVSLEILVCDPPVIRTVSSQWLWSVSTPEIRGQIQTIAFLGKENLVKHNHARSFIYPLWLLFHYNCSLESLYRKSCPITGPEQNDSKCSRQRLFKVYKCSGSLREIAFQILMDFPKGHLEKASDFTLALPVKEGRREKKKEGRKGGKGNRKRGTEWGRKKGERERKKRNRKTASPFPKGDKVKALMFNWDIMKFFQALPDLQHCC